MENEFTVTASDDDDFANAYSAENESNLFNAYYERPAMLGLAGEVSGRRILDAGCGSGPLSAALRARGAVVTGMDVSAAMVDLARERLGEDADVHVADLGAPLPFADAVFDDVVASFVLHYLEDWAGPLARRQIGSVASSHPSGSEEPGLWCQPLAMRSPRPVNKMGPERPGTRIPCRDPAVVTLRVTIPVR